MDWAGHSQFYHIEDTKSITIYNHFVTTEDDNTFLSILYRDMNEQMISAIVCLNESNAEWKYDFGVFEHWCVRQWVNNDKGGITVAAEYYDTSEEKMGIPIQDMHFVCFDGKGDVVWKSVLSILHGYVPHVMEYTEECNYIIWGNASMDHAQSERHCLRLVLDRNGRIVGTDLKSAQGDCYRYIDGNVYVIVYTDSDFSAQYIAPFAALEGKSFLDTIYTIK